MKHKRERGSLADTKDHWNIEAGNLFKTACDFLVPAALGNAVTEDNAGQISARAIIEGANGPLTCEADQILGERGVDVVPDILANAGGVIVSYFEWVQNLQREVWSEERVAAALERILGEAADRVFTRAATSGLDFRSAAFDIAVARVKDALEATGI